ncbi:MAG: Nramp family divalent metal transporter [Flavobacteriales bacterium]|nr:Nramp family divalent metal transporter [Flavobacteriales bacterium]
MMQKWYKILGPGLLYAGAAIGVSHLVQSTRAGAEFGYGLVWAVFVANILKYPFFEFGPRYAAVTGKSLLEGYQSLGKWSVYLFLALTFCSMFIIQSAVTVVTAGIASEITGVSVPVWLFSAILLAICSIILMIGKFKLLDISMKVIILVLTTSTIVALVASFTGNNIKYEEHMTSFVFSDKSHILFLIALMGWMPAPLDLSVWHSLWTLEKKKESPEMNLKSALLDFNIGYWGTLVLALFFLILGSVTIYGSGIQLESSGAKFANQLIGIYTNNIGKWSYFIIAVAAFTTMLSTTLTCLDAQPRVISSTLKLLHPKTNENKHYWIWLFVLATGVTLIVAFFMTNMRTLIDFATIIAFVTSPILAIMNYLVITSKNVPKQYQPNRFLKILSWLGITYFIGFTIYFLFITFNG